MVSKFRFSIHTHKPYKHTAPTANNEHMLIVHAPHTVVSLNTHTHTRFHFFGAWWKAIRRQTMSSHGVYPPSGPRLLIATPPCACSEGVYLLFISLWGQHHWEIKILNPLRCDPLHFFYTLIWWPFWSHNKWLAFVIFSIWARNNSMWQSISRLALGWRTMSSISGVRRCVWGGDLVMLSPSCCSVSPKRLQWHMTPINWAEITSSRLVAPSIVRMTSSPFPS